MLAINVQGGSRRKTLQWIKDVLAGGGCITDAAADCWMEMLDEAGITG